MRGRTIGVVAALVVMTLGWPGWSTAAEWNGGEGVSTHRGNPARTGQHPGPNPTGEVLPRWQAVLATTGVEGSAVSDVVVAGGSILVGVNEPAEDKSGALVALDAASGAEHWRFAPGLPVVRTPSVIDGVVYGTASAWGDHRSLLFAVDAATGAEQWRIDHLEGLASPTAVVGELVYVVDSRGTHAFEAATGVERWHRAHSTGPFSSPAVANDTVYVGTGDFVLLALDSATGKLRWSFDAGKPVPSPVAAGALVYIATVDYFDYFGETTPNAIIAVDASTGQERWRTPVTDAALNPELAVADAMVVIVASTLVAGHYVNVVAALDATTGRERWRTALADEGDDWPGRSPIVVGDRIYAGLSDIRVFDLTGGEQIRYGGDLLDPNPDLMVNLASNATPDPTRLTSAEPASLAVVNGTLYVLAYSLRALRADFPGEIEGITILVALGPSF